ncbi:hypothetical protein CDL12_15868 [Handroanthus impetiginosus]|uniref:MULE transposase domain-containing protein n=1 Tax=Handroanthus impetiginosus TaxID=429701 RepID=A0A2G9H2K5_9LAMI|nr:hypothetical protein CDL12_15868 [Handroanthus impetiginosus]
MQPDSNECTFPASSKYGCSAKLKISRSKEEPWRVAIFDNKHNHDVYAPNEAYLLRSQRNMTKEHRMLFNTICNSGVPPARAFGLMQNLAGEEQNLGVTQSEAFKVESDITLINIFFRDSQWFADYESFEDVLSFDITYKTNKYRLIYAPFCQAMINAIRTVFPATHHRLCEWHINQNGPSHFGSLNTNSGFKHVWTKCMSYCDHVEEFEATWQLMVETYNTGEQKCCGLMATSRSEGTNTALKKAIRNATSFLLDCVHGYEKPALLARHNPLLKHTTKVYKHNIFHLFQNEFKDFFNFECMEEPTYPIFSLRRFTIISFGKSTQTRVVEMTTILQKVYTQVNLKNIPNRYRLQTWTKNAKNKVHTEASENGSGRNDSVNMSEMAFVSHATKKIHDLAMRCTPYEEARYISIESINNANDKINAFMLNMSLNDSNICSGNTNNKGNDNVGIEMPVRDPPIVRSRGITSLHKCHWEDKSKTGKGKTSYQTTKGLRQIG